MQGHWVVAVEVTSSFDLFFRSISLMFTHDHMSNDGSDFRWWDHIMILINHGYFKSSVHTTTTTPWFRLSTSTSNPNQHHVHTTRALPTKPGCVKMSSQDGILRGGGKPEKSDPNHGDGPSFEHAKARQPHHSVGFWHHKMSKVRKHVIVLWIRTGNYYLVANT